MRLLKEAIRKIAAPLLLSSLKTAPPSSNSKLRWRNTAWLTRSSWNANNGRWCWRVKRRVDGLITTVYCSRTSLRRLDVMQMN
ncbi:hypothetical protein ACGC1H_000071 [Rhizoctonia solani]